MVSLYTVLFDKDPATRKKKKKTLKTTGLNQPTSKALSDSVRGYET